MAKITYEDEHTEKIWKRMSNFSGAKKDVKYVRYNGLCYQSYLVGGAERYTRVQANLRTMLDYLQEPKDPRSTAKKKDPFEVTDKGQSDDLPTFAKLSLANPLSPKPSDPRKVAHDENKNAETVENGSNAEGNVNQNPVNQPMEVLQPTTPDKAQPVVVQMTLDQKEEEEAVIPPAVSNTHQQDDNQEKVVLVVPILAEHLQVLEVSLQEIENSGLFKTARNYKKRVRSVGNNDRDPDSIRMTRKMRREAEEKM